MNLILLIGKLMNSKDGSYFLKNLCENEYSDILKTLKTSFFFKITLSEILRNLTQ